MAATGGITRRGFLKGAGRMAAGMAVFPQIVRAAVLGKGGARAPSERIVMAGLGTGGMGRADLNCFLDSKDAQVVAVCAVKPEARNAARDLVNTRQGNQDCIVYEHFWDLVARDDIDAVLVASNDHWHVLHALAAVRSGKDVYVEKPMGVSIEQVQALRDAVHRHGRVFQFGTQQRSSQEFRHACELVRNKRIGKLVHIDAGVHSGSAERSGLKRYDPEPIPEGFDYDLWLGPAPVAPYIKQRTINPHWFHASDYSLGYVSGWGIHHIDIAQWGHGTEETGPVEIDGSALLPTDDAICDNPRWWDVHCRYEDGVTMHFTGAGPGLDGVRQGITFKGTEGWVWVNRGAIEAEPKSLLTETFGPDEIRLPVSDQHQQNFLDAVRARTQPIAHIDTASRSDIVCQLSWIAFMLQRKLRWDPKNERFIDDEDANRMLKRAMREPWRL